MPTIGQFLAKATATLRQAGVPSARLDSELLLSDELGKNKAWILAHPEVALTEQQASSLNKKLAQRQARTPIAYIRGYQEFYGREFIVNSHVLIPRPESEAIIDEIKKLTSIKRLVDVGTGSGCLAISAALELPGSDVQATDISNEALAVAKHNATKLTAKVSFAQGNLLEPVTQPADCIIANLPYVDPAWQRSAETNHEPKLALFANNNGLTLINALILQAAAKLNPDGYLLLEADPRQHQTIIALAQKSQLTHLRSRDFVLVFRRVS